IAQHSLRITDVVNEPLAFLTPIGGYENMPLVSLEEAVKPLVPLLPAVQSHAYVAKQRCEHPTDDLTSDESASIMLYTMSWVPEDKCLYVALNKTLRSSENRDQNLKPWYLYLRLFLNALYRLPPLRGIAYRGVKLNIKERYHKDKLIVWWAFSSTTITLDVLQSEQFLGLTGERTIFNIEYESARDIRNHSFFPCEDELLLMAATQFKVISKLNQGNLCIIHLRETPPPFPLLHPVPLIVPPVHGPVLQEPIASANVSTSPKLSKPEHRNRDLEENISKQKGKSCVDLCSKNLTAQDMEIVVYYLMFNNQFDFTGMKWLIFKTTSLFSGTHKQNGANEKENQNKTLTTLNPEVNKIGDEGARHLADALTHNTTLTTLNLEVNKIGDEGARHLADALTHNTTLTTLNLSSNKIGHEGARHLADALRHNASLTTLNLEMNQIGDEGARHLADALTHNTTLTTLYLRGNQIGDEGARHLADALTHNTTLTTLDLSRNKIGDEGARHLADALRHNTTLTTLDLSWNEIGDEGARHLADALTHNATLTTLDLSWKWNRR
ncbi:unnamed protein product, partial [Adineta ricciae]